MKLFQIYARTIMGGTLLVGSVVSGLAGDSNVIILGQTGQGNTLLTNQSFATGSNIGGIEISGGLQQDKPLENLIKLSPLDAITKPALQNGSDNSATVKVTGNGGGVILLQNNSATTAINRVGNKAEISLSGNDALAIVSQTGNSNLATVNVNGALSSGTVLQNGDGNVGDVAVPINNTSATLVQNGNNNDTKLQVTGVSGGSVSYTVNANNTSAAGPVVVITNGTSVTITQNRF